MSPMAAVLAAGKVDGKISIGTFIWYIINVKL